uniref:Cell division cycle 5-like protein n=1 Tax=Parastrongyloides trichosuri TaxID=131310 RepID=A0A0N4ZND2_PARTI
MVKVIIKGGVWKNTEDEILKAAVMKYGKNQWSRIASLLHRKSAKQCKARWEEWLDPRIKKTEWSREEDEKLLHLAKIMPTQWRTIAPMVGRTAAQCLERYDELLDEAQRRAEGIDDDIEGKDVKKLKAGEIDPAPESRPARPDPIDMDEDELEMLSEARARLANTKGKKAKRKAREKQLSEARRLSALQRKRELRAAGIDIGDPNYKAKKKEDYIDYNASVPFQLPIPAGFYDPSDDSFNKSECVDKYKTQDPIPDENKLRREDKKKIQKRKQEELPETIFKRPDEIKRSKLVLPAPQVTDKEIEEIVKLGKINQMAKEMIDDSASSNLLHDYEESSRVTFNARSVRTPAIRDDHIAKEVETILALQNTESSLKGGLNTPLNDLNIKSGLPEHQVASTPNVILQALAGTPIHGSGEDSIRMSQTPAGLTPAATPFRDQLNLNKDADGYDETFDWKAAIASLPKPTNQFEIVLPDENEEEEEEDENMEIDVEDAFEVNERRRRLIEEKEKKLLKRRSTVYQRKLLQPSKVNFSLFKKSYDRSEYGNAMKLISKEMENLVKWDVSNVITENMDNNITPEMIEEARKLVEEENTEKPEYDHEMASAMDLCFNELISFEGKLTRLGNLNRKDQMDSLVKELDTLDGWLQKLGSAVAKIDKKLQIKMIGYFKVADKLIKKIEEKRHERQNVQLQIDAFSRLYQHELGSIERRIGKLQSEVNILQERENELQKQYGARMAILSE